MGLSSRTINLYTTSVVSPPPHFSFAIVRNADMSEKSDHISIDLPVSHLAWLIWFGVVKHSSLHETVPPHT